MHKTYGLICVVFKHIYKIGKWRKPADTQRIFICRAIKSRLFKKTTGVPKTYFVGRGQRARQCSICLCEKRHKKTPAFMADAKTLDAACGKGAAGNALGKAQ